MTQPLFVHATIPLHQDPAEASRRLHRGGHDQVAGATADAVVETQALRDSAGFRGRAQPRVVVRPPRDGELGVLVARWESDAEATGWPSMDLLLTVTARGADGAAELVVLSPSHAGYDLTTNRIDKVWRDRLGRGSVRAFAMALARRLAVTTTPQAATAQATDGPAGVAEQVNSTPRRGGVAERVLVAG